MRELIFGVAGYSENMIHFGCNVTDRIRLGVIEQYPAPPWPGVMDSFGQVYVLSDPAAAVMQEGTRSHSADKHSVRVAEYVIQMQIIRRGWTAMTIWVERACPEIIPIANDMQRPRKTLVVEVKAQD